MSAINPDMYALLIESMNVLISWYINPASESLFTTYSFFPQLHHVLSSRLLSSALSNMKTMTSLQATSTAVMVVAAMILGWGMVAPTEGSRALLNLGKLIDHLIDCPPPPAPEDVPVAPEPYNAPYSDPSPVSSYIPPDVLSPAPAAVYEPSPEYQSPPSYDSPSPVVDPSPSPVYEPSPQYQTPADQTPPAGGY